MLCVKSSAEAYVVGGWKHPARVCRTVAFFVEQKYLEAWHAPPLDHKQGALDVFGHLRRGVCCCVAHGHTYPSLGLLVEVIQYHVARGAKNLREAVSGMRHATPQTSSISGSLRLSTCRLSSCARCKSNGGFTLPVVGGALLFALGGIARSWY